MLNTIQSMEKLLKDFQALPKVKQNRTVMQVSGYPHYENVCSNILAFFFDPEEEHGLNDLLLQSLFKVIHQSKHATSDNEEISTPELPSFEKVSIEREYTTDGNKRIDLVITGDDFVIGIENKIYHWLANDLNHYSETLDKLASESLDTDNPKVLKAVLGLHPVAPDKLHGGFTSITYDDLWKKVQQELGYYLPKASQKWVTYLLDFIETTKQLTEPNMELKENDQFFIDHEEEINALVHERNQFIKRLADQVSQLKNLVTEQKDIISKLSRTPWIYKKQCLVLCFQFKDENDNELNLAFDLCYEPRGWELQFLGRCDQAREYMHQLAEHHLIKDKASEMLLRDRRIILQTWPIQSKPEELLDDVLEWIKILPEAAECLTLEQPAS